MADEKEEQKTKKEEAEKSAEEKAKPGTEKGAEQGEGSPINEAKEILAKIKEQNKVLAENLKRAEKAGADLMLAGRAPAGAEKTKEDEVEESSRKLLEGTGLEEHAGFKKREK